MFGHGSKFKKPTLSKNKGIGISWYYAYLHIVA